MDIEPLLPFESEENVRGGTTELQEEPGREYCGTIRCKSLHIHNIGARSVMVTRNFCKVS